MGAPGPADLVDLADSHRVEPRNVGLLEQMATITVLEHSRHVEATRAATRNFMGRWDHDVVVTPTSGLMTPPAEWAMWDLDRETHTARLGDFPSFARPFNLTGQPAMSIPLASTSTGLPLGIQLAGRHLEEATLLRLAAQLEAALPWDGRLRRMAAAL